VRPQQQSTLWGIQLVVCGDFYQLPPVNIRKNKFAFEAKVWPKVITTSVCLTSVFRQNQDLTLVKILNEARVGELSQESILSIFV
jgi:ATP-dependent DNA helicase PIF1